MSLRGQRQWLCTQQSHSNRATVLSVLSEPRSYKLDQLVIELGKYKAAP
jgi:hypothetical protein